MLFTVWDSHTFRPTRDVDFLGFGSSDAEDVKKLFTEILTASSQDDGLRFDIDTISVVPIRAIDAYGGLTVTCLAYLGSARVNVHIDIGFGDIVTPQAEYVDFPALLPDFQAPKIRAYPIYTAMAEKLEAAVRLGDLNTRMKDFFDLWYMVTKFNPDRSLLAAAIKATFEHRGTPLPPSDSIYALSPEFAEKKAQMWRQFLSRNRLPEPCDSFQRLVESIATHFKGSY
jgi:Nucleotidyl transferase AbiEii toxin, Type IV TA system